MYIHQIQSALYHPFTRPQTGTATISTIDHLGLKGFRSEESSINSDAWRFRRWFVRWVIFNIINDDGQERQHTSIRVNNCYHHPRLISTCCHQYSSYWQRASRRLMRSQVRELPPQRRWCSTMNRGHHQHLHHFMPPLSRILKKPMTLQVIFLDVRCLPNQLLLHFQLC